MEIKPFRALRYNPEVVGKVGDCIVPPYDLSRASVREHFYKKNEFNIVRIVCGKTTERDSNENNQYTRAAAYLESWIRSGALKQDSREAVYAYVQDFEIEGRQVQRCSFLCLAKLEDYGGIVRAHETTLTCLKDDFLKLQVETDAQFGLIFMLYEDPKRVADKIIARTEGSDALLNHVDEDGVRQRLYAITDGGDIEKIRKMMADKSCIIADGHHRYATALAYYKDKDKNKDKPAAEYQMMGFVNTLNEGMVIFATHRLVSGLKDFSVERLLAGLKDDFEIFEFRFDSQADKAAAKEKMLKKMKLEAAKDRNAYGIYAGDGAFRAVVLRDRKLMDRAAAERSEAWRRLEVAVLHKLILERLLGIGEMQLAAKSNIEYVTDRDDAAGQIITKVDAGEAQAAFFVNPEKIRLIQQTAGAGEKMPQKSTFFWPKMYTGLTIYKM